MRMNDANVYGVGAPKVLQENAYMLLYVRDSQRPYRTHAAKALAAARAAAQEKELAKVRKADQNVLKTICHEPMKLIVASSRSRRGFAVGVFINASS